MTIKDGEYGWVWLQWIRDQPGINTAKMLLLSLKDST
jgi:hypothetical protein